MLSLRSAVRTRRIRSISLKLAMLGLILLDLWLRRFIWLLPERQVALDDNADGIVVLTGGTSRVSDALELLASGRGKRLLITGVNTGTTTGDIAREVVNYNRLLACCVDLDYSALNTLRQCGAGAALGAGARLPVAHRRHFGLSHAARARRTCRISFRTPALIPFPVVSDRLRIEPWWSNGDDHPTGAVGISQIPCRQGAHAVRFVATPANCAASAVASRVQRRRPAGFPWPDQSRFTSARSPSMCCSM